MEKELKQSYSRAGAMHILALSGLHTGIIYTILGTLLSPLLLLPCGYIIKEILTLVLLVIYALVCGAPPSVVRACTMIIIYRISGIARTCKKSYGTFAYAIFYNRYMFTAIL